jgi:alanine racemase
MGLEDRCWLDISLPVFAENVRNAKATLAVEAKLMVAVKSGAYGHGGRELARVAVDAGADALAVLDIDTGVHLRAAVPDSPMLAWLLSASCNFVRAHEANITLGVSHMWQLEKIALECAGRRTTVHLKIDTGLHRNGALAEDWPDLVARAAELETAGLINVEGVWSHLADTSVEEDARSLARFMDAVSIARSAGLSPNVLHIAASAAATDFPESRLDMVRVGISAYGVSPFADRGAEDMGFTPVMSAHARVTEVDTANSRAIVSMGFADGLFEIPPGIGWVLVGETSVVIDSVELDHMVLRVPAGATLNVGDVATLWGQPHRGSARAEDWASWASTIGDEIVTAVAHHVPRRFLNG